MMATGLTNKGRKKGREGEKERKGKGRGKGKERERKGKELKGGYMNKWK